jgi:aspartate kinase
LSFTVPAADLTRALKRTQNVIAEIDPGCKVVGDDDVAVVYVLGVGMRTHTGVGRMMFGALAGRGINIAMINTSEVCIGVVIDRDRGDEAVAALKQAFGV